jgi:putative transposase
VFMPEHVHLLIVPRQKGPEIGKLLARFKQPFSKYVKEMLVENHARLLADLTIRERPGKSSFRFWQEGAGFAKPLRISTRNKTKTIPTTLANTNHILKNCAFQL